jgi:predicted metal-dependent HD superfamily phosphohydrolase
VYRFYTSRKRYYHNLTHLEKLFGALSAVQTQVEDWNTALFALFYHDLIYNPLRKDNEEQSALRAQVCLQQLNVPPEKIARCAAHIRATQGHQVSTDADTNLFTDADLSILGQDWDTYSTYIAQIRKEYAIYPDLLYRPGRQKVLRHFLAMDRIYKTDFFFKRYEEKARENMGRELLEL